MATYTTVFSPEKTIALVTAVAVAIIGKVWNYIGLPLYWLFRHMVELTYRRDPALMRSLAVGLFPEEMTRNAATADHLKELSRDVDILTNTVKPVAAIALSVEQMVKNQERQTLALESLATHQNEQNINVARLDERVRLAYEGELNRRHHDVAPPYERSHTRSSDKD